MDPEANKQDAQLVAAYCRGNADAMAALVQRHRQRLFGFVYRMTGNRQEAEDIFQEVWLRVVKNIHRYRERCFGAWLFRIARNLMIDRRRARRDNLSLNEPDAYGAALQDRMADSGPAPDDLAAQGDLCRRVAAAVAQLPAEQREVFLMRMEGGLSFKEIAAAQTVSINTALARMQYALLKLRTALPDDRRL